MYKFIFLFALRVILIIRDVTVVLSDCEKIGDPYQLGMCDRRSDGVRELKKDISNDR